MLWDVTVPAVLGYLAATLYNQNNVAAEASPVTTLLEMEVGRDLCAMLATRSRPWTPSRTPRVRRCRGGTSPATGAANIESMMGGPQPQVLPGRAGRRAKGDARLKAREAHDAPARRLDRAAGEPRRLGTAEPGRRRDPGLLHRDPDAVRHRHRDARGGPAGLLDPEPGLRELHAGRRDRAGQPPLLVAQGRGVARARLVEPHLDPRRPRRQDGRRPAPRGAGPLPGQQSR